jgi:PPM family protein phosphatase
MSSVDPSPTRQELEFARTLPDPEKPPCVADCFGLSDIGRARTTNEDAFLIASLERALVVQDSSLPLKHEPQLTSGVGGLLLIVADGLGGMGGGDVASRVAVATVADFVVSHMPLIGQVGLRAKLAQVSSPEIRQGLDGAIHAGGDQVRSVAQRSSHPLMGTTLTLAYVLWPRLYVAHAGDSRCYLSRQGQFSRLTRDHSVGGALARSGGHVGQESDMDNLLLNALGAGIDVHPDVSRLALQRGDQLLLCSDGLSKDVPDESLASVLARRWTAERACHELIAMANAAGGGDNITVVIARF